MHQAMRNGWIDKDPLIHDEYGLIMGIKQSNMVS